MVVTFDLNNLSPFSWTSPLKRTTNIPARVQEPISSRLCYGAVETTIVWGRKGLLRFPGLEHP